MNHHPLITIVTPSYNQGQFIEETILSVLNQDYKNIQYILVDGGSSDETMEVVEKYRDKIDIVIHEKDKGQTDAINKGFKLAKGELVGWINSDDILFSNCVSKIVEKYLGNPDGAIYYSSHILWLDKMGNHITQRTVNINSREHLLNNNYVLIQPGSFYSSKMVEEVNYLDIQNYYCMDLALWLDLLELGPIYAADSDNALAGFRMYEGTKTDSGKIKFLMNIKKVLMKKGAKWYSKTIWKGVYFFALKSTLRKFL